MAINILRRLRVKKGWSIRQLAEASGVNQTTITLIEGDKRKSQLTTLNKLAEALGVELELLEVLEDKTAVERGRLGGAASKGVAKTKRNQAGDQE